MARSRTQHQHFRSFRTCFAADKISLSFCLRTAILRQYAPRYSFRISYSTPQGESNPVGDPHPKAWNYAPAGLGDVVHLHSLGTSLRTAMPATQFQLYHFYEFGAGICPWQGRGSTWKERSPSGALSTCNSSFLRNPASAKTCVPANSLGDGSAKLLDTLAGRTWNHHPRTSFVLIFPPLGHALRAA